MSDDKDEVGSTQKALMGMMGLGAGIGAMYMLLRGGWGARAKRLFIEEPDVTLDTMVPADEEIGALEREQGRMLLAQLLVELMRQGTTDYNENREKLAEQGVRGPRDVMVPNDMLHRVMFEAWSSGWRGGA
jgi:predicted ABC-type transport system involved in lysophospholipase L1 biosynthesis ATPase subunit